MTDSSKKDDFTEIPTITDEMWENAVVREPVTKPVVTPISDTLFSVEAYAALGRLLASFGALEHHLVNAVIDLHGGPDVIPPGGDVEKTLETAIKGAIPARARIFVTTYRAKFGANEWIDTFEVNLKQACEYRNHFAHGLWRETAEGWMHCTFWKRGKEGKEPQEMVWYGPLLEVP